MTKSTFILFITLMSSSIAFSQNYLLLPPAEFQAKLKTEQGTILDVRTPGEYKKGHLEGATLINLFDDDFEARIDKLDKSKTYFVYCAVGGRSNECTDMMRRKGFKNIIELQGGFTRWSKEKMPYVVPK